jgi:hypothetical protein
MDDTRLTDVAVEKEIARLQKSEHVKLAQLEQRLKLKRRKYMYDLRWLEKRGKELAEIGLNAETLREYLDNQ